jgi:hypothetical protein
MSAAAWGAAYSDPLPALEGQAVQLIDNQLLELPYPVPVTLCFTRGAGGYVNAEPRALVEFACGSGSWQKLRCDWQGQGAIVASRLRVSIEGYRPLLDSSYSVAPVDQVPRFLCTVGLGALTSRTPLTYTSGFKLLTSGQATPVLPPPAFAKRMRALGSMKGNAPAVLARSEVLTSTPANTNAAVNPSGSVAGDLVMHAVVLGGTNGLAPSTGWTEIGDSTWPRSALYWRKLDGTASDALTVTAGSGESVKWLVRSWRISGAGETPQIFSATATSATDTVGVGLANTTWTLQPGVKNLFIEVLGNARRAPVSVEANDWTNYQTTQMAALEPSLQSMEKLDEAVSIDPPNITYEVADNCRALLFAVRGFGFPIAGTRALSVNINPLQPKYYLCFDCTDSADQPLSVHPLPDRTSFRSTVGQLLLAHQYELSC